MSEPRDLATPPTLADALLSGRPNEAVRPLARFRPPFTEDAVKARGGARMAGRRAATRKARALDLVGQTARGDLAEALRGLEQALREEQAARQDERVRRVIDDLVDSLTGRASAKPEARMSEALEALLKVSQTEVER